MKIQQHRIVYIVLSIITFLSACTGGSSESMQRQTTYTAVTVGEQTWMSRNLDVTHYRNGDPVRHAKTEKEWHDALSKGEGAWCSYDNSAHNARIYGHLYNWYAVHDPRGLAPQGWHIPSDAEWQQMIDFLGGNLTAGGRMKAAERWRKPNAGANDSSTFNALPGGSRNCLGSFYGKDLYGYYWSTTQAGRFDAWDRELFSTSSEVRRIRINKSIGFSVRCIRN